jgi:hypothetical protein
MGDSNGETDDARPYLFGPCHTWINMDHDEMHWIFNHIDRFVSQSRGNKNVERVDFYPYVYDGQGDEVWDKVAHAIGNLQGLETLHLSDNREDYEDENVPTIDWEILTRILSQVRQKIDLNITFVDTWDPEESRLFARAIHGHPMITSFDNSGNDPGRFPYESLDALYSALATLPALESIRLSNSGRQVRPEEESALAHPESLTELLRVPTLRSVCFQDFDFTTALFQATANALIEGTAVTKLEFDECSFSAGECALMMASGLSRNTSVTHISVQCSNAHQALIDALAAALPSNSTLQHLTIQQGILQRHPPAIDDAHLPSVFSALGKNKGLKTLYVCGFGSMDASLCTAMKDGLGMNATLESLVLTNVPLLDDNAYSWGRAFSFLRTNKALKSLQVDVDCDSSTESSVLAFCRHIAAALQDNSSLESLSIFCNKKIKIKAEAYFVFVTALQHNTTLKSLNLQGCGIMILCIDECKESLTLTHDEDKQMTALLKKNYALESLPIDGVGDLDDILQQNNAAARWFRIISHKGDVGSILRLNEAGRRYLIQDGSSISKGVEVLSRVNNDINCVFVHLLENPRLCDRSAVEMVIVAGESNGSSRNPTASSAGGKREQATAHKSKESRRRLA